MLFINSGNISVKNKSLGANLILKDVEVPQIDEKLEDAAFFAEAATFCGSSANAKSYFNEKIKTSARAIPSQLVRSIEAGSDSVIKQADGSYLLSVDAENKARAGAKDYSPRIGEGVAAQNKKNSETVSGLQALLATKKPGEPVSADELMALLAGSK